MKTLIGVLALVALFVARVQGQVGSPRPPVIDIHVHSTNTTAPEVVNRMKDLNIRYVVVAGPAPDLLAWEKAIGAGRYLPSLTLPCPRGRALFVDRPCWEQPRDFPDTAWLRGELRSGQIKGLGEMVPQYLGIAPGEARFEPYWQLAEESDIPVFIHMGPGPPSAAYESSPYPIKFPDFRMALGDPLLLEDVLLRHKKLRIVVMHAGWPFLDSIVALLYAHPNVYVDVGALQAEFMVPRAAYYRHLRGLVEAGFGKRIVFGSDFPNQVASGIDAIVAADFLTEGQKADILCNNAARLLRLDDALCKP